jgi:hypothetical protein
MSQANIPNITPTISITKEEAAHVLLASIALEELALGHVINAEAEKIQFVLGTLSTNQTLTPTALTIQNLLSINGSVQRTLQGSIKKEILLQFKFENTLALLGITPSSFI